MSGHACQRDGHVSDSGKGRPPIALSLTQLTAPNKVAATTLGQMSAKRYRGVTDLREQGHVRAHRPPDRPDKWIIRVEDHPAVRLRDPADRRLDLGKFGQCVNPL